MTYRRIVHGTKILRIHGTIPYNELMRKYKLKKNRNIVKCLKCNKGMIEGLECLHCAKPEIVKAIKEQILEYAKSGELAKKPKIMSEEAATAIVREFKKVMMVDGTEFEIEPKTDDMQSHQG